jgi:hypothetical protein
MSRLTYPEAAGGQRQLWVQEQATVPRCSTDSRHGGSASLTGQLPSLVALDSQSICCHSWCAPEFHEIGQQ